MQKVREIIKKAPALPAEVQNALRIAGLSILVGLWIDSYLFLLTI